MMSYQRDRAQMAIVGERLSALMRERGISVAALAASVHIQQSTLENLRGGYRTVPSDVLTSIAQKMRTSVGYLFGASEDPSPTQE
jgi:transcriptional regulator with XRE-family HTH domain